MSKRFSDIIKNVSNEAEQIENDSNHSDSNFAIEENLEDSGEDSPSQSQKPPIHKSPNQLNQKNKSLKTDQQEIRKTLRKPQDLKTQIPDPSLIQKKTDSKKLIISNTFSNDFPKREALENRISLEDNSKPSIKAGRYSRESENLYTLQENEESNSKLDLKIRKVNLQNTNTEPLSVEVSPEQMHDGEIKQLKQSLKKLFNFYASFANRLANFKMKCSQFLKLATDAGINSKEFNTKKIQLIFISINKNQQGVDYETFIRVLHQIAQEVYSLRGPNANFKALLDQKIIPLYNQIYEQTDLGVEDKILHGKIQIATLMIVHFRKEILLTIYSRYFAEEKNATNLNLQDKVLADKSKQGLLLFLREFEILPSLVNIGIVNNFYNELSFLDSNEQRSNQSWSDLSRTIGFDFGRIFTFNKFVYFLVKISIYVFSDCNNIPKRFRDVHFSSDEKFYMLLERLEISQGFFDIAYGKFGKSSGTRLTLLSKELADLHKETSAFLNFEDFIDESDSSPWMILNFDLDVKISKPKHAFISKMVEQNVAKIIEFPKNSEDKNKTSGNFNTNLKLVLEFEIAIGKFRDELKKVFMHYSAENGKDNAEQMNCFRFINFLKDAQIVKTELEKSGKKKQKSESFLALKEADILFNTLTHNGSCSNKTKLMQRGKSREPVHTSRNITFDGFLKALEIICDRIFPELNLKRAFETLYFQHIFKHLNGSENPEKQKNTDLQKQVKIPIVTEKMNLATKNLKTLCEILKNEELIIFLQSVHKAVFSIYQCYCQENSLINYSGFFSFFRDYEIFPEIISKIKLESVFESLSYVFLQDPENRNREKQGNDLINQHLFVEAFILIAQDCKFNLRIEPSIFQKITYLLDIMNESQGFSKTLQRFPTFQKTDIVGKLRKTNPDYFIL